MTDKLPAAKFPPYVSEYPSYFTGLLASTPRSASHPACPDMSEQELWSYGSGAKSLSEHGSLNRDYVNRPAHYTAGKFEAIDVIEDAVTHAPSSTVGFLQAQVLKYILRMWLKGKTLEDAKKARWYLNRLIDKLEKQ